MANENGNEMKVSRAQVREVLQTGEYIRVEDLIYEIKNLEKQVGRKDLMLNTDSLIEVFKKMSQTLVLKMKIEELQEKQDLYEREQAVLKSFLEL